MADLFLAIDAGGTAVKAAVFDARGSLVASSAIDVVTEHRDNGWVERDPEHFWQQTAGAVRTLIAKGLDPARIAAVACTGFGNGVFMVDDRGRATRPGIVSVDQRAQAIVDRFREDGLARSIEELSGQRIWGGQTLMQLVWLKQNEPATVAASRFALACKDFIRMRLTGIAATDPTDASGGGLLNIATGVYDAALFDLCGISDMLSLMPPVMENSAFAGRVSAEAAALTGLAAGTPVATAMMDVGACVIGSGVVGGDVLTMIAGTWSINAIEAEAAISRDPPLLDMIHRDRECHLLADGSPTSASNLSWYLARLGGPGMDLAQVNRLVEESPIKARRCHFLPFVNGPAPRRGAFLGLVNADDTGSMLRALFEGVAFQHRRHGEDILAHRGSLPARAIRLAGGASKSEVWSQIFADVTGYSVEVAEGEELGALGAAICAAVATGHHADFATATRAMCRLRRTAAPDPDVLGWYEDRYHEFLRLDQKLADLFS